MSERIQLAVGFHSFGDCKTQFAVSLSGAVRYEGTKITSMIHVPSPYVTEARNKVFVRFLRQTHASHCLMMDVDLEFPEDAISLTLRDMHASGAEIMFGNYALGDWRPSLFSPPPDGHLPCVSQDLEHSRVYEIYAGSTGWLLVTRAALEKIWANNKDKHWPFFDHDPEVVQPDFGGELRIEGVDSIRIGEDFTFSKRAREAGLKIFGTTSPLLIHQKTQPLLSHFQEELAKERGLGVNRTQIDADLKEKKDELAAAGEGGDVRVEEPGSDSDRDPRSEGAGGEVQEGRGEDAVGSCEVRSEEVPVSS